MADKSNSKSSSNKATAADETHQQAERAAGRERVAQLLGKLLYRYWKKQRDLRKDQGKPKSS